jgi:hypothetical protein
MAKKSKQQLHPFAVFLVCTVKDKPDANYYIRRTIQVDVDGTTKKDACAKALDMFHDAFDDADLTVGTVWHENTYSVTKENSIVDAQGNELSPAFDYWVAEDDKGEVMLVDVRTNDVDVPFASDTGSKSTTTSYKYTPLEDAFTEAVILAIAEKDSHVEYDTNNRIIQAVGGN